VTEASIASTRRPDSLNDSSCQLFSLLVEVLVHPSITSIVACNQLRVEHDVITVVGPDRKSLLLHFGHRVRRSASIHPS
jgi:hypothetical protein